MNVLPQNATPNPLVERTRYGVRQLTSISFLAYCRTQQRSAQRER
jgi:hypothetical protein